MIPVTGIWSIEPQARRYIERGLPEMVKDITARSIGRKSQQLPYELVEGTAIINIVGIMTKNESIWSYLGMGTSTRAVRESLQRAVADHGVRDIVLQIDSPGGSVDGQHDLVDEIQKARKVKRIVAQVDGMAASAAYWAACQCEQIHMGRGDLVGSIGTVLLVYDFSKEFERKGIEAVPITTGAYKATGAYGTEITQDQRAYLQRMVNAMHMDFRVDVRRSRRLTEEQSKAVSDGRLFVASDAVSLGLVDGIRRTDTITQGARSGKSIETAKARQRLRAMIAKYGGNA